MAEVLVDAPGGAFSGSGNTAVGVNPGGQFSGDGTSGTVGPGLSDTILWIGPAPPSESATQFVLWINTADGRWYGKWSDGTSTQWVDLSLPFGEGKQGAKGLMGDKGDKGDTGTTGQGIPTGGAAEKILVKTDATDYNTYWGDRPTDGIDGVDGVDGVDGNTILYGVVAPTTEGVDGDFYIDTISDFIYGPKASGTWPAGTSIVGPAGLTGPAPPDITRVTDATGARVAVEADFAGGVILDMTNASAQTYTIGTGIVNDQPVILNAKGAGQVTVVASGTTLESPDSLVSTRVQYSQIVVEPHGSNVFSINGDLV